MAEPYCAFVEPGDGFIGSLTPDICALCRRHRLHAAHTCSHDYPTTEQPRLFGGVSLLCGRCAAVVGEKEAANG